MECDKIPLVELVALHDGLTEIYEPKAGDNNG
jgi:hypothetical protein